MGIALDFEREMAGQTATWMQAELTTAARGRLHRNLVRWLAEVAVKKQGVDLTPVLTAFCKRLEALAQTVRLVPENGRFSARAAGESAVTLSLLRRGTDWFLPAPDVDALILASLFSA